MPSREWENGSLGGASCCWNCLAKCKRGSRPRKLAAQYIQRDLCEADEANLLDEEDMIIFGLRPMTDPLDLVCCNTCTKPIKASQYTIHAELCKSLISRAEIVPELDISAAIKKPPRKERKKLVIAHNRNMQVGGSHCINGSSIGPYYMNCPENVALHSSKPLTGEAAEAPSNLDTKKFCITSSGQLPYVPAPLATKVYYSQRSHYLRRAICLMYCEGSNKECDGEYPSIEVLPVNAVQTRTSSLSNSHHKPAERTLFCIGHKNPIKLL